MRSRFVPASALVGALALPLVVPAALVTTSTAQAATAVSTRVAAFTASPTSVVVGKQITVKGQAQRWSGKAWAASSGSAVVSFDPDGSAGASAMRTLKSDNRGNFSTSFTATRSGTWFVSLKASGVNKASTSSRVHVTVTAPALISQPPAATPSTPLVVAMAKGSIDCPAYAPLKGNLSSRIFHAPGQRYYARTKPEFCFATPAAAVAQGFRAALV